MTLPVATVKNVQVKSAQCPYAECSGERLYWIPDSGIPQPVDMGPKFEVSRLRYAVGYDREVLEPFEVTVSRQRVLEDEGLDSERYVIKDSFTLDGQSWGPDELLGCHIRITFPDPEDATQSHRVNRKVASNTADTVVIDRALPAVFETSLDGVKVDILAADLKSILSDPSTKVRKKFRESYVFICNECGKPYTVEKP